MKIRTKKVPYHISQRAKGIGLLSSECCDLVNTWSGGTDDLNERDLWPKTDALRGSKEMMIFYVLAYKYSDVKQWRRAKMSNRDEKNFERLRMECFSLSEQFRKIGSNYHELDFLGRLLQVDHTLDVIQHILKIATINFEVILKGGHREDGFNCLWRITISGFNVFGEKVRDNYELRSDEVLINYMDPKSKDFDVDDDNGEYRSYGRLQASEVVWSVSKLRLPLIMMLMNSFIILIFNNEYISKLWKMIHKLKN